MPNAPRRLSAPGSRKPKSPKGWKYAGGPNPYGWDWQQVRDRYKRAHPLCEICLAMTPPQTTVMQQVHHKQPFKGINDPLRLAWANLQSVCVSCHRRAEHARR